MLRFSYIRVSIVYNIAMILFEDVTKYYPASEEPALYDVNLVFNAGEFVSIVGHSGAGKSTLLKLILAEETPDEGTVYFESKDVQKLSRKELNILRRRMGTIFQDFRLLSAKTVYENIAFALEVAGADSETIESDVPYVLELVDLKDKADAFPHELSGGQQQRVAIARAIVNQPDVLIADEPTGNLDPVNTYEIVQILKKINELGTTVVLTTHNKGIVEHVGGRVVTMDKGRVIRDDKDGKYIL